MSKFTAKKRLNNTINPDFICPLGYQRVKSFNYETTYSKETTKFLIVGTLTPPDGRGQIKDGKFPGYFYCSENNDMYMFLDESFKERKTKFVDLKRKFRENDWNKKDNDAIKTELKAKGVAFLDVVDEAYTLPNNASDDAIHSYKCDYEAFGDVNFKDSNLTVIANSKNAKIALEHIIDEINDISDDEKQEYKNKIILVPQSLRGYLEYHTKDDLKAKWKEVLSNKQIILDE